MKNWKKNRRLRSQKKIFRTPLSGYATRKVKWINAFMGDLKAPLAENEYKLSLEEIFRGRPVVESTFFNTYSIVNDGRESTD